MKFFEFNQNNSGGSFVVDDKVCHILLIEADSNDDASDIAEGLGVYYDGCESGIDCDCCGDRWNFPWDSEGVQFPFLYGTFTSEEANKIVETYNGKVKLADKAWRNRDTDVIFETPESYAQYRADEFGQTLPDVRIFYKNGEVKEIFCKRIRK